MLKQDGEFGAWYFVFMGADLNPLTEEDILPDYCKSPTLVLGCGNRLFGDDGFGPAVADYLVAQYDIPDDVYIADAGTGVRNLLFTLCLSPRRPRRIVIIDAMDRGKSPGTIFELPLGAVPLEKTDDFSLHQAPSSNLARELQEAGVEVRVIACQTGHIPDVIEPGLSGPVAEAVPALSRQIAREYFQRITACE